jgi:hypothetical protein
MNSRACVERTFQWQLRPRRPVRSIPVCLSFTLERAKRGNGSTVIERVGVVMLRMRIVLSSWFVAGALLTIAPCLQAQEAKSSAAIAEHEKARPGAVRVVITTPEDDLLLTVTPPGKDQAIVSCYDQCTFWGVPGSYSLLATSAKRSINYQTTLNVGVHTEFRVSSGHTGAQTAGLVIGVLAPIVAGVGFLLVTDGVGKTQCDDCAGRRGAEIQAGLAMFWGGLLATPVGWAIFGTSSEMRIDPVDKHPIPVRAPRLQLGAVPLPRGGWGVGLSAVF